MKKRMTKFARIGLILAVLVSVALLSALWTTVNEPITPPFSPRRFPPSPNEIRGDLELYYTAKTVISSVNVTLLVILLITYISIYRKTQSEFTIGLILFSMVLLLYALVSNPIIHFIFGFRAFGLGPFATLPDLFSLIASAVLLYLTVKY